MPNERVFVEDLAPERTEFLKDLELLRQQEPGPGRSWPMPSWSDGRVLNGSLRFRDEFVRHKILDVIGTWPGRPSGAGHVVARNAGHALITSWSASS